MKFDIEIKGRNVAKGKTDKELIESICKLLQKEVKDPSKATQKCKDAKFSFILFTVMSCLSYLTLISNSFSFIPKIYAEPERVQAVRDFTRISDWEQGELK